MNKVERRLNELDGNKEIIVHCKSGVRSANICRFLLKYKCKSVKNLKGGLSEWAKKIDTKISQYR